MRSNARSSITASSASPANASSTPTAVSAWMASRRRSMADYLRFRDDAAADEPAVSLDSFFEQPNAVSVRIEAGDDPRPAHTAPCAREAGRSRLSHVPRRPRLLDRAHPARGGLYRRDQGHRRRAGRSASGSCGAAASTASRPTWRLIPKCSRRRSPAIPTSTSTRPTTRCRSGNCVMASRARRHHRYDPTLHAGRRRRAEFAFRRRRCRDDAAHAVRRGHARTRCRGQLVRHRKRGAAAPRRAGGPRDPGDLRRYAQDVRRDAGLSRDPDRASWT